MQIEKIDVSYQKGSKPYSFNPNGLELKIGDVVVVDTARGDELGYVCSEVSYAEDTEFEEPLKNVIRIATPEDLKAKAENVEREKEIKKQTEKLVKKLQLDMKVTNAELNLDRSKVVINFTSEDRVDFRELVKELASILKIRIELKQIGSRVETQVLGGIGPCGRQVCCNLFLKDFDHATIKMAKNQNLSLNPTKISGLCGRLMCCLSYENEHYSETLKLMPKVNKFVMTPEGKGQVVYNNLLQRIVQVKFDRGDGNFEIKDFPLADITPLSEEKE